MESNNYKAVFQGLDTLHVVYIGFFEPSWWESSELIEDKVTAQKKRDKPFARMEDLVGFPEIGTCEYAYCLMSENNNRFEADFSSATIQPTDDGKPGLKLASRKEAAYGNL
ncbi:MAG: hypothetical protein ACI9UO_002424 [Nitrospinales bacterium]|jgi:hypothetical protein